MTVLEAIWMQWPSVGGHLPAGELVIQVVDESRRGERRGCGDQAASRYSLAEVKTRVRSNAVIER